MAWSLCYLVRNVRVGLDCAQTAEAERIEMPFGRKTHEAP